MSTEISQGSVETLLQNQEGILKREHMFLKVNELISLLKDDKIYVPDAEYQRPFRFKQKQFMEIIVSIKRNMMLQSISLVDHKKQIEWLESELNDTTDNVKRIQIQEELNYYNGLYINGLGYLYSLVDGQHRGNYVRKLMDVIYYYNLESIYNTEINKFFNIELFSWIVWGVYRDDMVVLFQSINTARNINTDGKIWGINSVFNNQLKELATSELKQ